MTVNRSTKEIKLNKLFAGVSDAIINSIFKIENFKEAKEGEIIYRSGDDADFLYLLLRGDVKIKFPTQHYISNKIFNDFLGEKELADKTRRISSAVANSRCLLYLIAKSDLQKIISKSPIIAKNINTYGELELPEIEASPKSGINLSKSDKPISFSATKPKKEQDEKKDEIIVGQSEEEISEAITKIIEEENFNAELIIDDDEGNEKSDDLNFNIKLDDSNEIAIEENPGHEEKINESTLPTESLSINDLLKVLNSIHDPLTLYETIQSVLYTLRDVTSTVAGEIYLINEDSGEMQKYSNVNGMIKITHKKISDGLTGTCALQKKILNFDKPTEDSRFIKEIDQPGSDGLKKIIYIPLLTADDIIVAVLQLAQESGNFSDTEVKLLEALSEQIAIAILRSKRHEQLIEEEKQKVTNNLSMFLSDNILIPVNVINRYTSLLNSEEFSQKVKEIISLLKKQANLFWDIVQTTFDYSKIDFELDLKKTSLNSYVDGISEILSEYCDSRKINLFKKSGGNSDVLIDPGKLFMAIYQIIKNACDASEPESNLYISTDKEEGYAKIIIQDEGSGIADEIKEDLFESVYDENKTRDRLGLVIAKRIIVLHNGEILFSSKLNEGTTFELKLPVYTDEEIVPGPDDPETGFQEGEIFQESNGFDLNKNNDH